MCAAVALYGGYTREQILSMSIPWLILLWTRIERNRRQTLRDLTVASGIGAGVTLGKDCVRGWSQSVKNFEPPPEDRP